MKTYCLRAVYEMNSVGFTEELTLFRGSTEARLIKERKLPFLGDIRISGVAPDGKPMVTMQAIEKVFRGRPLLLEITATSDYPDTANALIASPDLEGRISEAEAILNWSLPNTIGPKLADALFSRSEGDPPNKWNWDEGSVISVGNYYESAEILNSRCTTVQTALNRMPSTRKELTLSALQWWRYGLNVRTPPDKLIAHWISVESAASAICSGGSIGSKVVNALTQAFPDLATIDNGQRIKRLKEVLYRSRCKAIHAGKRDFPHVHSLVQLVDIVAVGCIRLLIDGLPSSSPSDDLLNEVGV
jgi:hypothetical protein